jgi:hypothetical protein
MALARRKISGATAMSSIAKAEIDRHCSFRRRLASRFRSEDGRPFEQVDDCLHLKPDSLDIGLREIEDPIRGHERLRYRLAIASLRMRDQK